MQNIAELAVGVGDNERTTALLATYSEICKSYHAIDEFRMKLLGLLPLASLVGIVLLNKDAVVAVAGSASNQLIGFVSVFAATFTLALFLFEIRGVLRCNDLIHRGREIEDELRVKGQFWVCTEADKACKRSVARDRIAFVFNAKVAACVIYSVVFAAWAFLALRYGYGATIIGCAISAVALGLVLACGAYAMVNKLIAA